MSEYGLNVAVIGATGVIGTELLATLARAPFDIARLVPIASRASTTDTLMFKDRAHKVVDLTPESLDGVDLAFAALPRGAADDALRELADAGCMVVDLAGIWAEDAQVPLVALGINPVELEAVRELRVVRSPGPLALTVAAIGAAAATQVELAGLRGTALLPASTAGRRGVEELSGQVVSSFNSKDPPRVVFPHGLAFDLLPRWGDGPADDWTDVELRAAADAARILGIDPRRVALSVAVAPMFSGMGLSLNILATTPIAIDPLKVALEEYPAVRLREPRRLSPRAQNEQARIAVGRVRADLGGLGAHLWASADPARLTAANAVALVADMMLHDLL
ncbi:MAG: hypothetical protein H6739_34140 [Alphaproteobacteria bacterium]|nr:hypothetical protein [Alphaproteobacteria bacterium]